MAGPLVPTGVICPFIGKKVLVTGATGTPIVCTVEVDHGYAVGDAIDVNGVGGNTAANGSWLVSAATGTTITLSGSTAGGAYTSGGYITPAGWLPLDGASYSWTLYVALRALVGNTYGGSNGVSFVLPDWRDRQPVGIDASATRITTGYGKGVNAATLGNVAGSDTHTLAGSETPSHQHSAGGTIAINEFYQLAGFISGVGTGSQGFQGRVVVTAGVYNVGQTGGSTSTHGGGGAHQNTPPMRHLDDLVFAGPRDSSGRAVLFPNGLVVGFPMNTRPSGWEWLNGQTVAGSAQPSLQRLLTALNFPFGGDATNFNMTEMRGRTVRSAASAGLRYAPAGAATVPLAANHIASHSHAGGTLAFALNSTAGEGFSGSGLNTGTQPYGGSNFTDLYAVTGGSTAMAGTVSNAGSAVPTAHENMSPYIVMNWATKGGAGVGAIPLGALVRFVMTAVPTSFLAADGSAVSRTTYAELFALLGTTYGAGNGSTTFNLPDVIGRMIHGRDDMGGTTALGVLPGATAVNVTGGDESALVELQHLPLHNHSVGTITAALYPSSNEGSPFHAPLSGTFVNRLFVRVPGFGGEAYASTGWTADQTGAGGTSPRHNNMPRFIAARWMIRAL